MAFYLVALLFFCSLLQLSKGSPMLSPDLMPNRLKRQEYGGLGGDSGGVGMGMNQGGGMGMNQGGMGMNQGGVGLGQGGGVVIPLG